MLSTNIFNVFTQALDVWDKYVCVFPLETLCNFIMLAAIVVAVAVTIPKSWLVTALRFYPIQGPHGVFAFFMHLL